MSAMILCRSRQVRNPYYVEELGIHLYSGEELCYYIYHNALLIGDDFLEERLFRFIGQELGMESLESKLRRWASQAELSELLLVILQDIHYYNSGELAEFRETLEGLDKLSAGQRMKMRGEYLLSHGRYSSAIVQYDRLLNSSSPELEDPEFHSRILLADGVCCARQFLWQKAADLLTASWKLQPSDHTACMLYQITCRDPQVTIDSAPLEGVSEEVLFQWKQELADAMDRSRFIGKGQEAAEWMDKDNVRRARGLRELTERWKSEYRRNQGG